MALCVLGAASTLWAASTLDNAVNAARLRLDNAQNQVQSLQLQEQSLRNTQTSDKQTQQQNMQWLAAEPAIDQKSKDDLSDQTANKPALQDKLKTLTDGDAERAKTIASDQDALNAAKADARKTHDDAFAAFVAKDPGMSEYAPVMAAREKLSKADAMAVAALESSAAYHNAVQDQKDAAALHESLKKNSKDLQAIAKAGQDDMTLSNKIQKMHTDAVDGNPAVKSASKELELAVAAFKPVLDQFEADLLTQPDYAGAMKAVTDAQNAVTTAAAAQKQAGDDEKTARKQIADMDSKAATATQLLKTSTGETGRRTAQNTAIDRELQNITQSLQNLDQQVIIARSNVLALQQQYDALVAQRKAAGG